MQRIQGIKNKIGVKEEEKQMTVGVLPNTSSSENIYYYAFFRNTENLDIKAYYNENRSQPILNRLSDYKMAVLSVDFGDIDSPYFITDEINLTFRLEYLPDNLSSTKTLFQGVIKEINTYAEILNEYNRLLKIAWDEIINAYDAIYGAGSWQSDPLKPQGKPGVTFDEINNLFTIWMDERCEEGNPEAVLWYSETTFCRLFQGVEIEELGVESRFKFNKQFGDKNVESIGSDKYIKNIQQYSSGSNWNTTRELLLVSNTLSCRKEYIGGSPQTSQALMRDVIGNYPVNISNIEGGLNPSSRIIIYNLVGTPRYIDLIGDSELYQLDFSLYYLTSTGRVRPVKIKPGQSFGIKVMFVKQLF